MAEVGAAVERFLQQSLCSGLNTSLTDCVLQRGGALTLLILALFVAILAAVLVERFKGGAQNIPVFLVAAFLVLATLAYFPSFTGITLAALVLTVCFIFSDFFRQWLVALPKFGRIRADTLGFILAPVIYALGATGENLWQRAFPPPIPPRAIVVLPSWDYQSEILPAALRVYSSSRDALASMFGSDRVFPTERTIQILTDKQFDMYWRKYARDEWDQIVKLLSEEYQDVGNRDLELIRKQIRPAEKRYYVSVAWGLRDRTTGRTEDVRTPNLWFTVPYDELRPMVLVADYLIASTLVARWELEPGGKDADAFKKLLQHKVLRKLHDLYAPDPPASLPAGVRDSLFDPESCQSSDCFDAVIDALRARYRPKAVPEAQIAVKNSVSTALTSYDAARKTEAAPKQ